LFRFLHAADIHLDSPLQGLTAREGAPVDRLRRATRLAMTNLVATAIRRRVDLVVISGDIFDVGLDDAHTGQFFLLEMRKLREAGIPVVLIRGNHDAKDRITYALPKQDRVFVLDESRPQTLSPEDLGIDAPLAIHGQSFPTRHVAENVVAKYPAARRDAFNIGLLHTSLENGASEHVAYAPCRLEELGRLEYGYWALGHIHRRSLPTETKDGKSWVVFPGNIQGRHIRERGPKGCLLVEVDDRGRCIEPEFVPLDVVRWDECRVMVTPEHADDDLDGLFRKELARQKGAAGDRLLALRVKVTGKCRADLHRRWMGRSEQMAEHFRNIALDEAGDEAWIEKVEFDASPNSAEEEIDESAVGELLQLIDELGREPAMIEEFQKALGDLRSKLPDAVTGESSPDPLRLDDPGWIAGQVVAARALLADRLRAE